MIMKKKKSKAKQAYTKVIKGNKKITSISKASYQVKPEKKLKPKKISEPTAVYNVNPNKEKDISKYFDIGSQKTCQCEGNKINCLTAKEWLKNQLGVWEFFYEKSV